MSTATRPARTSAAKRRPSSGGPAARAAARKRAQIVALPDPGPTVAGNGVFALVVVGMLVGGMVMLLVLNTSLAQGAFEIGTLTKTQNQLAVQEEQLLQDVARAEAPEALQARANSLGMVPVTSPVFLRLADGAVLGIPKPAKASRPSLPATGAAPTAVTAAAKPAAKTAQRTDAAQADPAPVTDAAAADPAAAR
ncbi:MAG: hypothetical protein U0R68_11470 [Candidatus Nanopelagicales bacterium]